MRIEVKEGSSIEVEGKKGGRGLKGGIKRRIE